MMKRGTLKSWSASEGRLRPAVAILAAAVVLLSVGGYAGDWPQYLGPNRNGVSPETGLARTWPAEGPKVLWTFPLGGGFAGPAVSEGKVYVLDRDGSKQDIVRCIDLASGKEDWNFAYDAPGSFAKPGSRSTPTVDAQCVYTCGGFGDLYCIDKKTHQPVWHKNIVKDLGGDQIPNWGVSQNPLLYGDLVIVAAQTPKAGVVAFDKKTGDIKWMSTPVGAVGKGGGYVSPELVRIAGEDQIVAIGAGKEGQADQGQQGDRPRRGAGKAKAGKQGAAAPARAAESEGSGGGAQTVAGLDPKTGRTLWSYSGWQCKIPVPGVVDIGDGRLFITGGYKAGSAMIKVEKKGAAYQATEVYKTQAFGTHVHPPILYKGFLYAHCTDNTGRQDGMVCMDLDGNVKWKTGKSPDFERGGYLLAAGLMFDMDGKNGDLYLVELDPQAFKKLASAKLLGTKECWAPMALSDGKLLIRDQGQMKCVAVR